jgi:protein-S-isoprenylcysteine O-methyltransferase Ste14
MAVRAVLVDRFQIRPEELALASHLEHDFSDYKASLRRWVLQAEDP